MAAAQQDSPSDWLRIAAVLAQHRVDYVLVGGVAAQLHGARRPTHDVDICPSYDPANLARLAAALRELGAVFRGELDALPPVTGASLSRMATGHWRTTSGDLDVLLGLTAEDGLAQFPRLSRTAVVRQVGELTILVAGLAELIAAKRTAGRARDGAALAELSGLHAPDQ